MKKYYFLFIAILLVGCASNDVVHVEEQSSFSTKELTSSGSVPVPDVKYIKASDNVKLAYREYLPESVSAILIFYHGATIHSAASYPHLGNDLKDNYGVLTVTPDLRGHGYSGGRRGDTPSVEQVYEDISLFVRMVKKRYPGVSVYLGGHSQGGGVSLNYSSYRKREKVDGYLFIAPYLGFRSRTEREMERPFVRYVKYDLFRKNGMTGRFGNDRAIFFNLSTETKKRFPRAISAITVNMANATTPMAPSLQVQNIDAPLSVWIGRDDEAFDPEKVVAFLTQNNPDVEVRIIEGKTHLSIILASSKLIGEWINAAIK